MSVSLPILYERGISFNSSNLLKITSWRWTCMYNCFGWALSNIRVLFYQEKIKLLFSTQISLLIFYCLKSMLKNKELSKSTKKALLGLGVNRIFKFLVLCFFLGVFCKKNAHIKSKTHLNVSYLYFIKFLLRAIFYFIILSSQKFPFPFFIAPQEENGLCNKVVCFM